MRMSRAGLAVGISLALSSCITPAHKPTPGWSCVVSVPGTAHASADLAEDGSLLLALWSWNWHADGATYAISAFADDGNAHSYGAPTTGVVVLPTLSSVATVVLSHQPGDAGWANPVVTGGDMEPLNGLSVNWDRLVVVAGKAEPLFALRRLGSGPVMSVEIAKQPVLDGARQLSEARALLSMMVADRERHCQHVDDLYPEIIPT